MAKLWIFLQDHPKAAFSEKVQTEKILAQNAAPKVPQWHSYGKLRKVTLSPHFSEKVQRGDQGKFFKNRLKSSLRLKISKALWRK